MLDKRRVNVPADHVAIILPAQLADELQSLIMTRRRKLGVRMSRLTQAEESVSKYDVDAINRSVDREDRWHEAKIERDVLNDLLLALVDAKEG